DCGQRVVMKAIRLIHLAAASVTLAAVTYAQPPWWTDNVVKIQASGKSGAGLIISINETEVLLLTAWHVIDQAQTATVSFRDNPLSPIQVTLDISRIRVNTKYDIAAFPIPKPRGSLGQLRPLFVRALQANDAGKAISLVGFPGGSQDWKPVINGNTITS